MRPVGLAFGALLAFHAGAHAENWQLVRQTADELVMVDGDSLRQDGRRIWFREKHVVQGARMASSSLRPVREIQLKRVADCEGRALATVSLSVFSERDALIDYQARRPDQAQWLPAASDSEVFRRVCG